MTPSAVPSAASSAPDIAAIDQIGLARPAPAIGRVGPDEQIGQAVAIDIAGRGDGEAGSSPPCPDELVEIEPVRSKSGSVMKSRSITPSAAPSAASAAARSAPLDQIGLARIVAAAIGEMGADDQIGLPSPSTSPTEATKCPPRPPSVPMKR
jgi:hypothetical protein